MSTTLKPATKPMLWYWVIRAGISCNGADTDDVKVSPNARGLTYGDGFFTTMGVQSGQVLWQIGHHQRLVSHLNALHLHLSDKAIMHLWQTVNARAAQIDNGMLKLIVTREEQPVRGYGFVTGHNTTLDIETLANKNHSNQDSLINNTQGSACHVWLGVLPINKTITSNQHKLSSNEYSFLNPADLTCISVQSPITALCLTAQLACLPVPLVGLKTLNKLDSVLIAGELEQYKQDFVQNDYPYPIGEGLVADISGEWVEGVMSNVFYQLEILKTDIKKSQWYTPPLDKSGVHGVMRQVIIERLANNNETLDVVKRRLTTTDLPNIKALFFCNAVRGMMPVGAFVVGGQVKELSLLGF